MVISLHQIRVVLACASAVFLLCQCETQRTVTHKRSTISFDEGMWGGQGGGNDSNKIRSKFAERGYSIGEDGTIRADNPNLYANRTARGAGSEFKKKEARLGKNKTEKKAFRTPEYIQRQQYRGVEEARESGALAREGLFGKSRDRQANKRFGTNTDTRTQNKVFQTNMDTDSDRAFAVSQDRQATSAQESAPRATGIRQNAGYQQNAGMTIDDVRRMLSPGQYARAKGLDE